MRKELKMKSNFLKSLIIKTGISKLVVSQQGYLFYLFGEAISKGIVFLLLGFFTNTLSKSEFGKLSLIWVSIPLFSVIIDFSQRSYVKSAFISTPSRIKETVVSIKVLCVFSVIVWIAVAHAKTYFGLNLISPSIDFLVLIAAFFYAIIELHLSLYQIQGLFKQYTTFFLLRNVTPYIGVAFIYLISSYDKAVIFPYLQIIIGLILVIYFLVDFDSTIMGNIKKNKIIVVFKKSLRFSLPLLPAMISVLALSFADRFIINYYFSESEVAEYTVAYTISSVFIAFFMATNKMWQKIILEKLKFKDYAVLSIKAKKYIVIVAVFGIIIGLISKPLLIFMSNETYLGVVSIIPVLLAGMFFYFLYTVISNIPFFYRNTILMAIPAIIAALINIVLNFIYLPKYGYKFAAITTAISYFLEFLIIYIICRKKYKIDIIFNAK